ncbi:MAG: hypothetical protein AB7O44_32330 [Hyphomicrobiaceae bacterium]
MTTPRILARVALLVFLAAILLLAGCAETRVNVEVAKPDGSRIVASYSSTKDIAAPAFLFERDPQTGEIQRIILQADGAIGSTVNAQTNELVGSIVEGAVRGAAGAISPMSMRSPASYDEVQALWSVGQ